MIPSDSGSRRAASGGALERRKMARASRSRTAATMRSVLRVRRPMEDLMREASGLSVTRQGWELGAKGTREEGTREQRNGNPRERGTKIPCPGSALTGRLRRRHGLALRAGRYWLGFSSVAAKLRDSPAAVSIARTHGANPGIVILMECVPGLSLMRLGVLPA